MFIEITLKNALHAPEATMKKDVMK